MQRGVAGLPPRPRVGGFLRFKIREAGGFTGNPLLPNVSNPHISGMSAYNVQGETNGLTGIPKMSKWPEFLGKEGGFTDNPPTTLPGGLARPKEKRGRGVGC